MTKKKNTAKRKVIGFLIGFIIWLIFVIGLSIHKNYVYEGKPGSEVLATIIDKSSTNKHYIIQYRYRVGKEKYTGSFTTSKDDWEEWRIHDKVKIFYSKMYPDYSSEKKWW